MRTRGIAAVLLALALSAPTSSLAQGDRPAKAVRLGAGFGFAPEKDDILVGAKMVIPLAASLHASPALSLVSGGDLLADLDLQLAVPVGSRGQLYAFGGLNARLDLDDLGLNLGVGAELPLSGGVRLFGEAKYVLVGMDAFVLGLGVLVLL